MRVLGIDVSVRRGLDLVLLAGNPKRAAPPYRVVGSWRAVAVREVSRMCRALKPDCVAVDSPPRWSATGSSRRAERELLREGIHSFFTPCARKGRAHRFYDWMAVGFEVFGALRRSYPLFRGGEARGHALEVFPHATAMSLGGPRPGDLTKRQWRGSILGRYIANAAELRLLDQMDAALAALTGVFALEGRVRLYGDPGEGVIVVPAPARSGAGRARAE